MKQNILFGILLISLLSYNSAKAQENKDNKSYNTIYVSADIGSAYNKVVDYIQDSDYFILSLDKNSGFIQANAPVNATINIGTKREYSANVGYRTLNFIIRALDEGRSKITLSIYNDTEFFPTSSSSEAYRDKGVSQDESQYKEILDDLIKAFM